MTFLVVTINRESDSKLERFVLWFLKRFSAINVQSFEEDHWAADVIQGALSDIDNTASELVEIYRQDAGLSFHEAAELLIADGETQDQKIIAALARDMGLNA